MFSPKLYIALVPVLYGGVFLLPLFTAYFQHQGQTAALFLLSFYWALAAVFWPGLKPRHLLLTIPVFLLVYPVLKFFPLYDLVALVIELDLAELEYSARLDGDFLLGLALHTFSALVAASGLTFRKKRARLIFRRAALDEEEKETLYEITRQARENPELSYYRYKTILEHGFALVAEQHGKILGVVHALLIKETLYIYGLATVPTAAPELELDLLRNLFRRGELPLYPGMGWFYWGGEEAPEIIGELQRRDFKLLQETNPRLVAARELLAGGLGQSLPMTIPLDTGKNIWLREIPPHPTA